jgi:hypothetical protein
VLEHGLHAPEQPPAKTAVSLPAEALAGVSSAGAGNCTAFSELPDAALLTEKAQAENAMPPATRRYLPIIIIMLP